MYRLLIAIYKELLLLKRDLGGLIILFVMPLALIVVVTMIQDSSFQQMGNAEIPVLFVDNDKGEISEKIVTTLREEGVFRLIEKIQKTELTEKKAEELVVGGKYQLAIVLPANLSRDLDLKIDYNVDKIMSSFDAAEKDPEKEEEVARLQNKTIKLYFDPAAPVSFKNSVVFAVDKMIARIEKDKVYTAFQKNLGISDTYFKDDNFIRYQQISSIQEEGEKELIPNSVQHNVPAWSLFAIFFIIVPLSINMVKEKNQGTQIRLIINPVPSWIFIAGKTVTYLVVSMIQFCLMLLVGMFLFPVMGLPGFEVAGHLFDLLTVAFCCGLAAIGLGILIGTIARTQEQAAPFGATFVVILAALGGVWVPVFIMPKVMQTVSLISPMNWGLNAFYTIVLRGSGIAETAPQIILLLLFFFSTILIAHLYDKKKRAV